MERERMRQCLDEHKGGCQGEVWLRESLSGTGTMIARCDAHYDDALHEQEWINRKYGVNSDVPPAWFDPAYAGERWDEEY